jgi:hypothetical protein
LFDEGHPQAKSYTQFLREGQPYIPNLIGKLLFIKPDEDDTDEIENLHRILTVLFIPWKGEGIKKPDDTTWRQY